MAEERTIKLIVEYDGTNYSGWQRQASDPTVQQHLEEALAEMCGHFVRIYGAGRTDSGVHARGQVASFRTTSAIPVEGFVRGLNTALPRAIAIASAEEAPADFEPRRWARGKEYTYRIWNRPTRAALEDRFCWHVHQPLDVPAMAEAGRALLGKHDFSAFRAADCDRKNPVRLLRRCHVSREGWLITLDLEATAFLKHMVRVIAGTLVEVGRGRLTALQVSEILASRDRKRAGRTAPAKGLTLERVLLGDGPVVKGTPLPEHAEKD